MKRALGLAMVLSMLAPASPAFGADRAVSSPPQIQPQHWSPEDLWHGIEVNPLPLEVHVIKAWEEDRCTYQKLTYVSEVKEETKIRIFAILGKPAGAKPVPGILHIPGGGQTASLEWAQYWARRGYA